MIGNVSEATRDIGEINSDATDPHRSEDGNAFGIFGGAWNGAAKLPNSASTQLNLNLKFVYVGLRLSFFEGENPFKPAE